MAMVRMLLLACLVLAPVATTASKLVGSRTSLRAWGSVVATPAKKGLADSKVIDGPDCGHVKQIIGKWDNAAKVGKLAGLAGSAVLKADADADVADKAAARSKEIGETITGKAGEYPEAIKLSAKSSKDAGTDATAAATALKTELDLFKGKISSGDFTGADVKDADIAKLQKLTKEAINAAGKADEASKETLRKAKESEKDAMAKTGSAAKMLKNVLDGTKSAKDEAAEISEKASDASKDAKTLEGKATAAATEIDAKAKDKDAKDQAPVWTALKEGLEAEKKGVTDADTDLTKLVADIKTATDKLKTKLEPIQAAADKAAAGSAVPDMTEELSAAQIALDDVVAAIEAAKAKGGTLSERSDKLEAKLAEVEGKLAKTRTLEEAKKNVA